MRLTDLDPEFIRWEDRVETVRVVECETGTPEGLAAWVAAGQPTKLEERTRTYLPIVPTLAEAQGIEFDCPRCQGPGKSHRIQVAFTEREVRDHHGSRASDGRPTRWQIVGGSGFADLSLSPSIDCTASNPACWHGFVTNGAAD